MKVVFFGTPAWAVPSLRALLAAHVEVTAVVTNPDRPAGRGMEPSPSPVKVAAQDAAIAVVQPASARDPLLGDLLRAERPDVAVVVAYGKLLPRGLLEIPQHGFVNLHFSVLPAYRGAAPVQRAIIDGCDETGVSVMVLTEGMDEGPVLATARERISPDDTAGTLGTRLAERGAVLLPEILGAYVDGSITPQEQDHSSATYAPKISSDETRVDWARPAVEIRDLVRGLNPDPGAWTTIGDRRIRIHEVAFDDREGLRPGELRIDRDVAAVGTGTGALALRSVQPAGKRAMTGLEFGRGARLDPGERFV